MKENHYYGHPNMARVRAKDKCDAEGKYTSGSSTSSGVESPKDSILGSTNGIAYYHSYVFGG